MCTTRRGGIVRLAKMRRLRDDEEDEDAAVEAYPTVSYIHAAR